MADFGAFLKGAEAVCGHNILHHDLQYVGIALESAGLDASCAIDTLYLSPLLFPEVPYHALVKDDKLWPDQENDPLADAIRARDLYYDELNAFAKLPISKRQILYWLLKELPEFQGFFRYVPVLPRPDSLLALIQDFFSGRLCANAPLDKLAARQPAELAYALSLADVQDAGSITPPWVLRNFPRVERVLADIRATPCTGCPYCDEALNVRRGLKRFFGFNEFRSYDGKPLQELAAQAAIEDRSLLAIFPTGGGKSVTFQVPALMAGEISRSLTIVIAPLQSLMKDQVDNLARQMITSAVTINGTLNPVERAAAFEQVASGKASLLYISPESLRSPSIERLLMGRRIARFVIDEAHCFSSWGQDFRVDYLYIGEFIQRIGRLKRLETPIPVSCFTATAKQRVIDDIRQYFRNCLGIQMEVFRSGTGRRNLHYQVIEKADDEEKYQAMRELIAHRAVPTIVYVSRTRKAEELARRLAEDGFAARAYHGKMEVTAKQENQEAFIQGSISVMLATSAFGMGVDKQDVQLVIHFDISDSLENYVQEAGRAGRDQRLTAECYILFTEEDLDKHFILLNQTKIDAKQVQQVWKAIKEMTRFRTTLSQSALDIARRAGWSAPDQEVETRVKTAIAALENAGYVKRMQNQARVYADSIQVRTAQEAIDRIQQSTTFHGKQTEQAVRIIKALIGAKNRKAYADQTAESRIDYLADHLGIPDYEVIEVVTLLRQEGILADHKDLQAFLKGSAKSAVQDALEQMIRLENFLFLRINETAGIYNLKVLNEQAQAAGITHSSIGRIRMLLTFWFLKNWLQRIPHPLAPHQVKMSWIQPRELLEEKIRRRQHLARFIIGYLFDLAQRTSAAESPVSEKQHQLVHFSVLELQTAYPPNLFMAPATAAEVEDTLLFLLKMELIRLEGGFLLVYQRMIIQRIEENMRKQYTRDDHEKLASYYENRVQQIHIVGEYAKKILQDYQGALEFVQDYFSLNYYDFLKKYFPGSRQDEIKRSITAKKFKQVFGTLSPEQLAIIRDRESPFVFVAAGPGSGKTRVLVHKLAALLLMEEIKAEQLLMLTFSREAATEFKKRLYALIGNAAGYVDIKTFHAFCFDLLGKRGTLEQSNNVIGEAIGRIRSGEVESASITRTVVVIDEAQDMNSAELELIQILMEHNEGMRLIAVGDDDQNIFEFRGADVGRLQAFLDTHHAKQYLLLENYRSARNLVEFSGQFAATIRQRLKTAPGYAHTAENGELRLFSYRSSNLVVPLVNDLDTMALAGSTAVLTRTNEQAVQVLGLLRARGYPAQLIQANEGFSLFNLLEIRYFYNELIRLDASPILDDAVWEEAKASLKRYAASSSNQMLVLQLIQDFEAANPRKKFRTDFESFVLESRMEDFYREQGETILISTIHKAKGKEFDNVIVLAEGFDCTTDIQRRQLYVGMTRARRSLTVHMQSGIMNKFWTDGLQQFHDSDTYLPPSQLALQLTHRDLWLDFFIGRSQVVSSLVAGAPLLLHGDELRDVQQRTVGKLSTAGKQKLEELLSKAYRFESGHVNHLVYWRKEELPEEVLIALPMLYFRKD